MLSKGSFVGETPFGKRVIPRARFSTRPHIDKTEMDAIGDVVEFLSCRRFHLLLIL